MTILRKGHLVLSVLYVVLIGPPPISHCATKINKWCILKMVLKLVGLRIDKVLLPLPFLFSSIKLSIALIETMYALFISGSDRVREYRKETDVFFFLATIN